jgi:hypothetical protein
MSADTLLSRLARVRRTGVGRYIASCPGPGHAHGDRHPSLGIREKDDGRILLRCYSAACSVDEIVGAVGLTLSDLFPPQPIDHARGERRQFFPSDVFEIARIEVAACAVIAADMHKCLAISKGDYARLFVAVERLNKIAGAAYGR